MAFSELELPTRVVVQSVVSSRYEPGERPISWDDRREGIEVVAITGGEQLQLYSSGGQSTPAPGWEVLLTEATQGTDQQAAYSWTLYGIHPK